MIIVLIGLYHDHICKKKRKDPSGYIRHLTVRSRSTISNWCRRLQAARALARVRLAVSYTLNSVFFYCSYVYIYIYLFAVAVEVIGIRRRTVDRSYCTTVSVNDIHTVELLERKSMQR
jgi:hypothetical protein